MNEKPADTAARTKKQSTASSLIKGFDLSGSRHCSLFPGFEKQLFSEPQFAVKRRLILLNLQVTFGGVFGTFAIAQVEARGGASNLTRKPQEVL